MIPESAKPAMEFRESHFHNNLLNDYTAEQGMAGECLRLPYMFATYSSYELREAFINAFNNHTSYVIHTDDECIQWEKLILFLKKNERLHRENLYPKVLAGYVLRSDSLANLRAIRFALSLLAGKHGVLMLGDNHIVKTICCRISRGIYFSPIERNSRLKSLGITQQLNGLFGVLPEIKYLLEAMLNSIFNSSGIFRKEAELMIDYRPEDFIQIERAINIILRERRFDTTSLPLIEKMTVLHKQKYKLQRTNVKACTELCAGYEGLSFAKNQAFLDEALRLLRQSYSDSLINGATRREEIIAKYGNPDQI